MCFTRWLAFGLQMPATVTTPGKPVNLTATLDDMGNILVQCDPVALAVRYRWRMLRVGIDLDYALAASTSEPMANIPGVLPGMTAQIIVQAVNDGLQGVASDPIVYSVPAAVHAKAEAWPAPAPHREKSANGTGGNGHANSNGSRLARSHLTNCGAPRPSLNEGRALQAEMARARGGRK